ncbi:transmembrane protein 119-like [Myxocyprinus asiaticus]|uniref:transmembrane protein 119-like n=1 Tax=Myxocyprinus asiaticus TaxID=70543 RepID=UPI002222CE49|nr:transmembrane protein 119-like [Myxocyprinus asiaticus]
MDHLALCCLIGLSIILINSSTTYATPVIFNDSLESSGLWESGSTDLIPTPSISSFLNESIMSTSIDGEKHAKPFFNQMVDVLEENLLLIIVITTLLLLVFTIICSAAILSCRRKVSTYYPCAFPSKMYVDERDKTGGERFFNEVPEKTNTSSSEEPLNSAKQLQEDIMLATKNLRIPVKTSWREKNEKVEDQKTDDEENPQSEKSQEESFGLQEDKTTNQSVVEDSVEKSSPSWSQDSIPVCDMEKTDPSDSGPPDESKNPSGPENSEIQDDMNKLEVETSGLPFISEEKTAF